jgi:hypothetical protein
MYANRSNGHFGSVPLEGIEIRPATPADAEQLERLRQLDSHPPLDDVALVAEAEGMALAAISADGEVIADPFRRTAEVVELLRLRAGQLAVNGAARDGFAFGSRRPASPLQAWQASR